MPESWVDKLFSHMAGLYGSKFADLWAATDVATVKEIWAQKLGGFADKPKAIKAALDALDEKPSPPTLPEFLTMCRDASRRYGDEKHALPHKLTREDHERMAKAARDAKRAVEIAGADKVEFWATHPRTEQHLRFIFDAAKNDDRFVAYISQMVSEGICTEDGRALKFYRDGAFQKVA